MNQQTKQRPPEQDRLLNYALSLFQILPEKDQDELIAMMQAMIDSHGEGAGA